jgi:hypothetical protein
MPETSALKKNGYSHMDFEDTIHISLPFVLKTIGAVVVVCVIVLYALFQARYVLLGPEITLIEELPPTVATSTVVVRGTAENIISITLNGRPIFTTDEGVFEEVVILPPGYTIVTIEAVDRYGSVTRLERGVVRTTNE